jgi:hypothetical protein
LFPRLAASDCPQWQSFFGIVFYHSFQCSKFYQWLFRKFSNAGITPAFKKNRHIYKLSILFSLRSEGRVGTQYAKKSVGQVFDTLNAILMSEGGQQ